MITEEFFLIPFIPQPTPTIEGAKAKTRTELK